MTQSRSGFLRLPMLAAFVVALFATAAAASYPEWIVTNAAAETGNVNTILTGDFDEDGRPDVVVRFGNFTNLILTKNDGTFDEPLNPYTGSSLTGLAVADVTNDGHLDVIVSDQGTNRIIVVPGQGDGTFASPIETQLTNVASRIAVADFNGDGKPDVALQTSDGPALVLLTGDGFGHFAEISRIGLTGSPYQIVSGDIDGDGKADVLIARDSTFDFQIFFGKGDGTFDAPVTAGGSGGFSFSIVPADLDGDGDAEIISTDFNGNEVTVVVNLGSRTFALPVDYPVNKPFNVVVTDATGDGKPDVIAALADNSTLGTFPGNGDGTLGTPAFCRLGTSPTVMTASDFDGDGFLDIAAATTTAFGAKTVSLFRNAPGGVEFTIDRSYPTISLGQSDTFAFRVSTPVGFIPLGGYLPPTPTGVITLREGAVTIATVPLQAGAASTNISSLPAGVHTLTADYSGDSSFRSAVSASVSVNVITGTTTTALTISDGDQESEYGRNLRFTASVTSQSAGSLSGQIWFYVDGTRSDIEFNGPPISWTPFNPFPVGTHTIYAMYQGNATQPPSTSNVVTVVIRKAQSSITLDPSNSYVQFGDHPSLRAYVSGGSGGNVRLLEGNTVLVTVPPGASSTYLPLPTLSIGIHYLRAVFDGNESYEPSESAVRKLTIYQAGALIVDAEGGPGFVRALGISSAPYVGNFNVYRRINSGAWTQVRNHSSAQWDESSPTPGVVYSYKMEQFDNGGLLMATSNIDVATMVSFTDDPIIPGMRVKAQHLAEVLAAVNALRAGAGLAPIALTDAGPGQLIRAAHISTIRTAVNEARSALGASVVPFPSDVTTLAPIRIQHMQDLREAVR
jgi:hypothetical protein